MEHSRIRLCNGSLYLDAALCDRYLDGVRSVALWHDGPWIRVIPLAESGTGGYLLKVRNARGDRVVHCPEFSAQLGLAPGMEKILPIWWTEDHHALAIPVDEI